jgi:hypothetical protein
VPGLEAFVGVSGNGVKGADTDIDFTAVSVFTSSSRASQNAIGPAAADVVPSAPAELATLDFRGREGEPVSPVGGGRIVGTDNSRLDVSDLGAAQVDVGVVRPRCSHSKLYRAR